MTRMKLNILTGFSAQNAIYGYTPHALNKNSTIQTILCVSFVNIDFLFLLERFSYKAAILQLVGDTIEMAYVCIHSH